MTTTTLHKPKLFGMIALSLGLITREQLEENLEIQRGFFAPIKLGDIMVARGVLTADHVCEVLKVQAASLKPARQPRSCNGKRKFLGEIMVERGYIEGQTLTAVLKQQKILRENGLSLRIGQILIANKQITRPQLQEALTLQATA